MQRLVCQLGCGLHDFSQLYWDTRTPKCRGDIHHLLVHSYQASGDMFNQLSIPRFPPGSESTQLRLGSKHLENVRGACFEVT
ncbi:hypothetical protein ASE41_18695 [Streptomyces sp. Root264]|nr:hypothetical protein ASE41_18695 [Streptomyces sp. Root264]